jgi:uncharacterized protein with HEPN domain
MQPDDIRLRHLVEAATKATRYASEHQRADLDNDELLCLALTKLVEITGEAAKQVTEQTRRQYPDVPWSAAERMQDRLVHHSFDIDLDMLWSTITLELPKLLDQLQLPETSGQSGWPQVSALLEQLTRDLSAWAAVVLIPKTSNDALVCAAHYQLPEDWSKLDNPLDSGSMNARAFLSQTEVVDNDAEVTAPPADQEISFHPITASAVVIVPNVGTLEVLANTAGYRFEEKQLTAMREAAAQITRLIDKS